MVAHRPSGQPDARQHHQRPDRFGSRRRIAVGHDGGAVVDDGGANAAGRKSVRAARRQETRSRFPVAIAVAADHLLGGVRMAGWIVLCRAQGRRWRHRNAGDHAGPQDADRPLRIRRQRSSAQEQPCRRHQIFRHRSGMVSGRQRDQRRILVDADDASQRRAAGGGLRGADRYRSEACRRHRHHHRTDAGVEFPVAADGRKIGRRLHPRTRRQGGRCPRSECQRGGGAENRSSAVSRRGRSDPERRQRLRTRRRAAVQYHGDAGRQGLSGGADADFVSGLVAGDGGAGIGISRSGADDDPEFADRAGGVDRVCRACCRHGSPSA